MSVPDRDYASVIESLTDDRREEDFGGGGGGGGYGYQQPVGRSATQSKGDTVTLSLKGVQEEPEAEKYAGGRRGDGDTDGRRMYATDSESETARISVEQETETPRVRPEEDYMDGFKVN